jgi:ERCC4-type nuclease
MPLDGMITTNEPKKIKKILSDLIELPMGYDIKLLTRVGAIGVERKKLPGDLLASIDDGRLGREIVAMREDTVIQVVLLHGKLKYNQDKTVYVGAKRKTHWTEYGINNMLRTIEYVEGCYLEYAKNDTELVTVLQELQDYMDKGKHLSLKGRPGIQKEWIVPTRQERVMYFYQGLPGIRVVRARYIQEKFPNPIDLFGATVQDICKVPGIGKSTATDIYKFIRGEK